jgi:hypothetical protein
MPRLEKSQIVKGAFITLDCSTATPVMIKRSGPPQYGSPPSFKNISYQLDAARKRLDELAKAVRDAKRR